MKVKGSIQEWGQRSNNEMDQGFGRSLRPIGVNAWARCNEQASWVRAWLRDGNGREIAKEPVASCKSKSTLDSADGITGQVVKKWIAIKQRYKLKIDGNHKNIWGSTS